VLNAGQDLVIGVQGKLVSSCPRIFGNTLGACSSLRDLVGDTQYEDGHVVTGIVLLEVQNGVLYTVG
jgi:hypothetical protein